MVMLVLLILMDSAHVKLLGFLLFHSSVLTFYYSSADNAVDLEFCDAEILVNPAGDRRAICETRREKCNTDRPCESLKKVVVDGVSTDAWSDWGECQPSCGSNRFRSRSVICGPETENTELDKTSFSDWINASPSDSFRAQMKLHNGACQTGNYYEKEACPAVACRKFFSWSLFFTELWQK